MSDEMTPLFRFRQSLQALPWGTAAADPSGCGSNNPVQHADRDGFDAGAHAELFLRPFDMEMRRRR